MARIDRYIALALLAFSIGYGYLAWVHPLLPFEARMPFKPNTMPLGLAVLGILFSSLLLLLPNNDEQPKDAEGWHGFAWKDTALLIGLAIGYAICYALSDLLPQRRYLLFCHHAFLVKKI
jgi:putative tricarboxylic transport membrane protein